MGKVTHPQKRKKGFRLRVEKKSIAGIARELSVSVNTVSKWENGWIDGKGKKHPGWKEELELLWKKEEDKELESGLMVKKERIKVYGELAQLVVDKVKDQFPSITAKTPADVKILLSEVRELGRLIAQEKGELSQGNQTLIAVKTDISLSELQERYRDARHNSQEESD